MISRRAFLKSLIVGVAATTAAPTFPLFVGECSTRRDFTQVVISQRKMVARIRITGAVIRDSVNKPPGTFAQWCRDEHGRIIREAAEEFKQQEHRAFLYGIYDES